MNSSRTFVNYKLTLPFFFFKCDDAHLSEPQVKPLLQVTRQEEEMGLKEEELTRAKEVAIKFESELKEITLKHTSVKDEICTNDTNTFLNFLLLSLDMSQPFKTVSNTNCMYFFSVYIHT